jgi:hypothetical protein
MAVANPIQAELDNILGAGWQPGHGLIQPPPLNNSQLLNLTQNIAGTRQAIAEINGITAVIVANIAVILRLIRAISQMIDRNIHPNPNPAMVANLRQKLQLIAQTLTRANAALNQARQGFNPNFQGLVAQNDALLRIMVPPANLNAGPNGAARLAAWNAAIQGQQQSPTAAQAAVAGQLVPLQAVGLVPPVIGAVPGAPPFPAVPGAPPAGPPPPGGPPPGPPPGPPGAHLPPGVHGYPPGLGFAPAGAALPPPHFGAPGEDDDDDGDAGAGSGGRRKTRKGRKGRKGRKSRRGRKGGWKLKTKSKGRRRRHKQNSTRRVK